MNEVLAKIRIKYIKKTIVDVIICISLLLIIVMMAYGLFETSKEGLNWLMLIFIIMMMITCSIGCISVLLNIINCLKVIVDPKQSRIIKKYKNVDKIIEKIYEKIEYQDNRIIISKDYILGLKDIEDLIKCDDVVHIIKILYKFNNTKTNYQIKLVDKDNNSFIFKYPIGKEKDVDNLILFLHDKCKNSKIDIKKIS